MRPRIGISLGDITGIGPEVTLKALAAEGVQPDVHYVLIGDVAHATELNRRLGLNLRLQSIGGATRAENLATETVAIYNPLSAPLPKEMPQGAPEAARAAVAWVKAGAESCLRGELDALVTAPVNKEAIVRAGVAFIGQTEMLSQIARTDRTAMMLLGQDDRGRWLRVALATTHVPLKRVADELTTAKLEQVIELAAQACGELGLSRARIGICGLNPHAGEGGHMGTEELTVIAPAVEAVRRRRNIDAVGPQSADSLFYYAYRGDYDAVVAMYHDQGLAPLKMVAFAQGVNWTLGLPFIRTSPDHGTAYDIAGRGAAEPSSMLAALQLARQLARQRAG